MITNKCKEGQNQIGSRKKELYIQKSTNYNLIDK